MFGGRHGLLLRSGRDVRYRCGACGSSRHRSMQRIIWSLSGKMRGGTSRPRTMKNWSSLREKSAKNDGHICHITGEMNFPPCSRTTPKTSKLCSLPPPSHYSYPCPYCAPLGNERTSRRPLHPHVFLFFSCFLISFCQSENSTLLSVNLANFFGVILYVLVTFIR